MKITVVVPTYNRAHALRQTLSSMEKQTHADWRCLILDDGSTDGTPSLVREYTARDARFEYVRYEENRGGVAVNEIGMAHAADEGDAWVRLGSDDWFLPSKLELDALALEKYGACYGPYRNYPSGWEGSELNVPADARATLLRGEFFCSWANIAVRAGVLREIRSQYGTFCDPRLRNMEDYLFNTRLARVTEVAWRGASADGRQVAIGALSRDAVPFDYVPDTYYRIGLDGASNSPALRDYCAKDAQITVIIRGEDHLKGLPVGDVPKPVLEVRVR